MTTDHELLQFAAKAAGVPAYWSDDGTIQERPILVVKAGGGNGTMPYEWPWNPLADDGDALRLAVKLGIGLDRTSNRCWTFAAGMAINGVCEEFYGDDPYFATRRAIVRAAAEIGKAMEQR